MKKLLLCSAAVVGMTMASAPAMAQVDLTVGGHTKNYVGWLDQDTSSAANTDERNFDILRESELHINAEATADNGLTYGFHLELEVDGGDAARGLDAGQGGGLALLLLTGHVVAEGDLGAEFLR